MALRVWEVGKSECCNGADTGFNVTRRESAPTSDRSFIAREFGEPLQEEIANDLI